MAAQTTGGAAEQAGGAVRGTNVMAILSLVFAFIFAPLGIVFGVVAKRQIQQTGEQGSGLAKAGFWLGIVFTALTVLWFVLIVVVAGASNGS
ncbi:MULTISPECIES: DUF4190 domain-containing protein [unclassified Plantactinospora]|uniref:DUF4190 domain-containing protein n=1 Tax=unclassified Plantactinospora TaxID=2631981 RepID=UPI000D16A95A|nr:MULTISPECIES: DUF4190 domain-containing protein [unclassified Plantactinospora]AVT30259.1 hypothetical protein C6361_13015 [Plantactinospora sp. BC1]